MCLSIRICLLHVEYTESINQSTLASPSRSIISEDSPGTRCMGGSSVEVEVQWNQCGTPMMGDFKLHTDAVPCRSGNST